jgi:putative iron-regulated protein
MRVVYFLSRPVFAFCIVLACVNSYACAVFKPPREYRNPKLRMDFDAKPQALALIRHAQLDYAMALKQAQRFERHIDELLANPSDKSLQSARVAWRTARKHYQRTEWLRFVDGPIDWPAVPGQAAGPESRLNAWPLNEAVIDYVKGAPNAGLINQLNLPITPETILAKNQIGDENDVTTGWHALEFLLWGQDFSATGPGARSFKDFEPGDPMRARRRDYLRIVTQLLINDLSSINKEWDLTDAQSYASRLAQLPSSEILGPALHGAASLIAIELHGERFAVALDSGAQEDEHSCFSDNTLADLRANLAGITRMLRLSNAQATAPDSLLALLEWKDPALAKTLLKAMHEAEVQLAAVPEPFDQLILREPEHPDRLKAEAALAALQNLATRLKATAETLGLQIVVPGV